MFWLKKFSLSHWDVCMCVCVCVCLCVCVCVCVRACVCVWRGWIVRRMFWEGRGCILTRAADNIGTILAEYRKIRYNGESSRHSDL